MFNQFDEHYSVLKLATIVKEVYEEEFGGIAEIKHVENPRVEKEEHYYNPIHENLKKLGFRRTKELRDEVELMLQDLSQFRDKILSMREVIEPRTFWKESRGGLVQGGEKVVEES